MYKLFWSPETAAFGPHVVLEEGKLDYELIDVDLEGGGNRKPDYLKINPMGKVPALVLPDGEVMYETAAIMLYLAEYHGIDALLPSGGGSQLAVFYRSLFYLSNTIQNHYNRYYYAPRYSTDEGDAERIKAKAADDLLAAWKVVDDHLQANGPYHLGDRFSMVDVYLVMLASWFEPMDALFEQYEAVNVCYDLVVERPGVKKCLG